MRHSTQTPSKPSTPIVLSPATPSELLDHILSHLRHPSTILICWPQSVFLAALVQDVKHGLSASPPPDHSHELVPPQPGRSQTQLHQRRHQHQHQRQDQRQDKRQHLQDTPQRTQTHPLLHASLLQRAVSRHLRLVFTPTLAHLRASLTTFHLHDPASTVTPPPSSAYSNSAASPPRSSSQHHPTLLVYGLLQLHRDGAEWSAQALGVSCAMLIEAAARNSLRPVLVEPRGAMGFDTLDEFVDEHLPILSGTRPGEDEAAFMRRSVPVGRVLRRWFDFDYGESRVQIPSSSQDKEYTRDSSPGG